MVLGGVNTAYATEAFTYHDLIHENYWMVGVDSMTIKGVSETGLAGIVDTGTSAIVGPTAIVNKIKAALGTVTCDNLSTLPDLVFTIGGKKYPVTAENYVLKVCVSS